MSGTMEVPAKYCATLVLSADSPQWRFQFHKFHDQSDASVQARLTALLGRAIESLRQCAMCVHRVIFLAFPRGSTRCDSFCKNLPSPCPSHLGNGTLGLHTPVG
jgi:hypothetical protein